MITKRSKGYSVKGPDPRFQLTRADGRSPWTRRSTPSYILLLSQEVVKNGVGSRRTVKTSQDTLNCTQFPIQSSCSLFQTVLIHLKISTALFCLGDDGLDGIVHGKTRPHIRGEEAYGLKIEIGNHCEKRMGQRRTNHAKRVQSLKSEKKRVRGSATTVIPAS